MDRIKSFFYNQQTPFATIPSIDLFISIIQLQYLLKLSHFKQ